jgi:spoIIIJ-associated protein
MTTADQIKQLVETTLAKMAVEGTVVVTEQEMGYRVVIDSPESAQLIGRNGETLDALQTIIRLLSHQLGLAELRLTVDINGYRVQKEEDLIRFVKEVAARVVATGQPETLRQMTSYERRLAHQAASEVAGAVSESTGEGADRRITVRPA